MLGGSVLLLAGCLGDATDDTDEDSNGTRAGREVGDVELSNAFPIVMTDIDTGDRMTDVHDHGDWAHWHQQPVEVPLNDSLTVVIEVYGADDERLDIGSSGVLTLTVEISSGSSLAERSLDIDELTLRGEELGEGELTVTLSANGDAWTPPPLAFEVIDPATTDDE